jgi:hypothetical protein
LATRDNDDVKRREVAESWSTEHGVKLTPDDINCEGCLTEVGIIFSHCEVCEIRRCGKDQAVENCAYCGEYICDKLENFLVMVPDAKKRLDEIRAGM